MTSGPSPTQLSSVGRRSLRLSYPRQPTTIGIDLCVVIAANAERRVENAIQRGRRASINADCGQATLIKAVITTGPNQCPLLALVGITKTCSASSTTPSRRLITCSPPVPFITSLLTTETPLPCETRLYMSPGNASQLSLNFLKTHSIRLRGCHRKTLQQFN